MRERERGQEGRERKRDMRVILLDTKTKLDKPVLISCLSCRVTRHT